MKKLIAILLAMVCVLSLCACGGGAPETTGGQPKETTPSAGEEAYTCTYEGVKIRLGYDVGDVVSDLGEPKDRAVTESCAFGGNDIVYDYRSVKISANDEEGFERVYCVELVDDMAQTEEGIKIGATAEAVTAAYGEPTTSNAGGVIYTKGGVELRFLMKDGKVTSIQYMLEGVA